MDIIRRALFNYLTRIEQDGFKISSKTFEERDVFNKSCLVLYFNIRRMGRSDDEIDQQSRQHKIELYFITGIPDITFKYDIQED